MKTNLQGPHQKDFLIRELCPYLIRVGKPFWVWAKTLQEHEVSSMHLKQSHKKLRLS